MRTKPKLTEVALNKWMRKQATDWEKIQLWAKVTSDKELPTQWA